MIPLLRSLLFPTGDFQLKKCQILSLGDLNLITKDHNEHREQLNRKHNISSCFYRRPFLAGEQDQHHCCVSFTSSSSNVYSRKSKWKIIQIKKEILFKVLIGDLIAPETGLESSWKKAYVYGFDKIQDPTNHQFWLVFYNGRFNGWMDNNIIYGGWQKWCCWWYEQSETVGSWVERPLESAGWTWAFLIVWCREIS